MIAVLRILRLDGLLYLKLAEASTGKQTELMLGLQFR